jgi:hypothetical protein
MWGRREGSTGFCRLGRKVYMDLPYFYRKNIKNEKKNLSLKSVLLMFLTLSMRGGTFCIDL